MSNVRFDRLGCEIHRAAAHSLSGIKEMVCVWWQLWITNTHVFGVAAVCVQSSNALLAPAKLKLGRIMHHYIKPDQPSLFSIGSIITKH
jgi:hypothetical protein